MKKSREECACTCVVESIESERAEAMMYEREEAMREARSKAICGVDE